MTSKTICKSFMLLEGFIHLSMIVAAPAFAEEGKLYLFPNDRVTWPNPSAIRVCWENGQEFIRERGWVQEKIRQEYAVHTPPLNFIGWNMCDQSNSSGIRIRIEDSGPHTKGLGINLAGKTDGMVLNFTFNNWGTSCRNDQQRCIENIAVHEFGHAIGLAHEQNRPDTFGSNVFNACSDAPQGSNGNRMIGPWDPDSVMNYCNELWSNNGRLSAWDVEGLTVLYGGTGRVRDLGYADLPRTMTDVNSDRFKDYCRIVGDSPNLFISCKFTDAAGFRMDDEYHYNSVKGIDLGYAGLPRYFADVNGDGRADYCRFVGDAPNIFLSCNLAGAAGFSANQYEFNSTKGIDQGYEKFRALTDVNGDGRADYCRFVGDAPNIFLSCNLAGAAGFSANQYEFNSTKGIDQGYDWLPRTLIDQNGDHRADYCRYVGDKPNIFLSCNLASPSGFHSNQYNLNYPPDKSAWYNQ